MLSKFTGFFKYKQYKLFFLLIYLFVTAVLNDLWCTVIISCCIYVRGNGHIAGGILILEPRWSCCGVWQNLSL
jgi:hypothetical protein